MARGGDVRGHSGHHNRRFPVAFATPAYHFGQKQYGRILQDHMIPVGIDPHLWFAVATSRGAAGHQYPPIHEPSYTGALFYMSPHI